MIKKILALISPLVLAVLIFASQQASACACCGTFKVVHVASYDVLNIRSGPSVRYRKVGAIPAGTACVIKTGRKHGKWHQIQYAEYMGWVNSHYLRFMSRP